MMVVAPSVPDDIVILDIIKLLPSAWVPWSLADIDADCSFTSDLNILSPPAPAPA